MNPLPTGPLVTRKEINQYFNDMKRWNFDIAYNAFYSIPYADVIGKYRNPYKDFAKESHKRGLIACVQIQSTVAYLDDIPLSEAQLYPDNSPHLYAHYREYGKKNFFASFCSKTWLRYLEKLTKLFIQDYGYDWVVFEEPMWIVDIPGKKDLFYQEFLRRYPVLSYPTKHLETPSYVAVQKLKQDILVEFYDKLTTSARKIGANQIGIMPWFFTPTHENTPAETFHSPCPTDRIIYLPNLDFVVVRMQPDNIYAGAMIGTSSEDLPRLYYLESMAHAIGKPVIVVNNPTNEHPTRDHPDERLIPLDYFTRSTLSIAASAPQGMTRHWYKKHYSKDLKHMRVMTKINETLPRLGKPESSIAFVYSYRAHWHTLPLKTFEVWKNYWNFAREMLFSWETSNSEISVPFKTFYSESIKRCLKMNPDVKLLVFNEYFPLTEQEVAIVEKWWNEKAGRAIVHFGTGNGFSTDEKNSGEGHHAPEILRLFGIRTNHFTEQSIKDFRMELEFTGNHESDNFLNPTITLLVQKIGNFYVRKNEIEIIYQDSETKLPIVTRRMNSKGNPALFFNYSLLSPINTQPIRKIINYLCNQLNIKSMISKSSAGILWNRTKFDYFILSNLSGNPGYAVFSKENYDIWNVRDKSWIDSYQDTLFILPLDFGLYRFIKKDDLLIDLWGMTTIRDIKHSRKKVEVVVLSQQPIFILLKNKPKLLFLDKKKIGMKIKQLISGWQIQIPSSTGFHQIKIVF